jgi:hypothetical protein
VQIMSIAAERGKGFRWDTRDSWRPRRDEEERTVLRLSRYLCIGPYILSLSLLGPTHTVPHKYLFVGPILRTQWCP